MKTTRLTAAIQQSQLKIQTYIKKHSRLISGLIFALTGIVLLIGSIYSTVHANYEVSANADFFVYLYLFKDFALHNIVMLGNHGNILLYPLYFLQSVLPYNYFMFSVVNIGLDLATILWWTYLLYRIFGRKYFPILCMVTTALLLTSNDFVLNITGDTIRNIEYPVALSFILLINNILKSKQFTRKSGIAAIFIAILFSAVTAGDSLALYYATTPILLVLAFYWLQSRRMTRQMWQALGLTLSTVLISVIFKKILVATGVISFFFDPAFQAHIVPASNIPFSITTTIQQLLSLHNANFFGFLRLTPSLAIVFVNFVLFVAAIVGYTLTVKQANKDFRAGIDITKNANFIATVLATMFFILPLVYIIGGQAVHALPNGTLVSSDQTRYLTLMPLLSVAGLVFLLQNYYDEHKALLVILPVVLFLTLGVSSGYIRAGLNTNDAAISDYRTSITNVINTAKQNGIHVLLTGYWYETTVRFWSHNSVQTASINACNMVKPEENTRLSWYMPDSSVHQSGILIDQSGPDAGFSNCTSSQLISIYGKPYKIVHIKGVLLSPPSPVRDDLQLWLYHYDVRSKVNTSTFNDTIGTKK